MNNKDKVFIKIKGLYTGTMTEAYETSQAGGEDETLVAAEEDAVEVINVGTYSVMNGKEYKMPIRTGSKSVAVIGTTAYATLAEAIAAATNGEVITLVNSTDEEVDLSGVNLVAARKGLTVHGVEIEF